MEPWKRPEVMREWWAHSWGHPALVDVDGHFVEVSPGFAALTGRTPVEMRGIKWQDITHPRDIGPDQANVLATTSGEQPGYRMRKRYRHKEGHWVPIWLDVRPIHDDEGGFLMFLSQITSAVKEVPIPPPTEGEKPQKLKERLIAWAAKNATTVVAAALALVAAYVGYVRLQDTAASNAEAVKELIRQQAEILQRVSRLEGRE